MTDQPTPRPDSQGAGARSSGDSPAGYEAPQFVPPQGPGIPAPPLYDQNQYGQNLYGKNQYGKNQYGAGQYGQPGGYNQPGANSQPGDQYSVAHAQPASPYGQGSSPYGQTGYGQPAYYGMPATQPKGLSIASIVCGIASVILGWLMIPQIAAIITGHLALRREPSGKGLSITGLVLGYLCLLGYGALWLLLIITLMAYNSAFGY